MLFNREERNALRAARIALEPLEIGTHTFQRARNGRVYHARSCRHLQSKDIVRVPLSFMEACEADVCRHDRCYYAAFDDVTKDYARNALKVARVVNAAEAYSDSPSIDWDQMAMTTKRMNAAYATLGQTGANTIRFRITQEQGSLLLEALDRARDALVFATIRWREHEAEESIVDAYAAAEYDGLRASLEVLDPGLRAAAGPALYSLYRPAFLAWRDSMVAGRGHRTALDSARWSLTRTDIHAATGDGRTVSVEDVHAGLDVLVERWSNDVNAIVDSSLELGPALVAVNRAGFVRDDDRDSCLLAAESAARRFGVLSTDPDRQTQLLAVPSVVADRLCERRGASTVFYALGRFDDTLERAAAVFIGMWDPSGTGDGIVAAGDAWSTARHLS